MKFRMIDEMECRGRPVILRLDLNVPLGRDENGQTIVTDDTRILRSLPTLRILADKGASIIILSHLGRPKGVRDEKYSLRPITPVLAKALGRPVRFIPDCIGPLAKEAAEEMQPGDVLLLENTRFHAGETANDPEFASELAANGAFFVNDAFSTTHRAHASTVAITQILPSFAGPQIVDELAALHAALTHGAHPITAIIGGAKISTKINLLNKLTPLCDVLAIGGAMANTLLAGQGVDVGASLYEPEFLHLAPELTEAARDNQCQLIIPVDAILAKQLAADVSCRSADLAQIGEDEMILDIGPRSVTILGDIIEKSRTLLWNGPLGAFEYPPFDAGTVAIASQAARLTRDGRLKSIAGGGDTLAALNTAGAGEDFSYCSTAGGAFLEWLEGRILPGIAALEK